MQAESCGGRRFLFLPATKGCQTEPPVVVGVGSVTDSPEPRYTRGENARGAPEQLTPKRPLALGRPKSIGSLLSISQAVLTLTTGC